MREISHSSRSRKTKYPNRPLLFTHTQQIIMAGESTKVATTSTTSAAANNQRYRLQVKVIAGRSLQSKDWNGVSDPYVSVRFGRRKKTTFVCPKTLEPQWNCTFSFPLAKSLMMGKAKVENAQLILHCWDKDFMSRDFMGMLVVPFSQIATGAVELDQVDAAAAAGSGDKAVGTIGGTWYNLTGMKKDEKSVNNNDGNTTDNSYGQLLLDIRIVPVVRGSCANRTGKKKKRNRLMGLFQPFFRGGKRNPSSQKEESGSGGGSESCL